MSLKEFFFKISFLYNFLPVHFLMKLAKKRNISLFYHFIKDDKEKLTNNLYKVKNITQFLEDIHFLKKYFTSITVDDFTKGNYKNKYTFFLSFDDGLSNFYHVVAPILKKEKVHAINFLNSNFINNQELFYRYKVNFLIDFLLKNKLNQHQKKQFCNQLELKKFYKKNVISELKTLNIHHTNRINYLLKIVHFSQNEYLINEKPYLTTYQIKDLLKQGFQFGGHSMNHPKYKNISLQNQIEETITSIDEIVSNFELENKYFAFPFSDNGVTNEFFCKIKTKVNATFGTDGLKDEDINFHFQRIPMEYKSVYSAETIIKGELIYYLFKKMLRKHKSNRN